MNNVVGILIAILGGLGGLGGLAALIKVWVEYKREPVQKEVMEATAHDFAVQALKESHAALKASHDAVHQDVAWVRGELTATREELDKTNERLSKSQEQIDMQRQENARTRRELHRLRDAWEKWWDNLLLNWHEYRRYDRPPPRPDRDSPDIG